MSGDVGRRESDVWTVNGNETDRESRNTGGAERQRGRL